MPTKKTPTPAQLEARKRFTAMAKSGELAKKRKATAPKQISSKISAKYNIVTYGITGMEVQDGNKRVFISNKSKDKYTNWLNAVKFAKTYFKTGLSKPTSKGLTTLCAKAIGVTGRKKSNGTVKKGHIIKKGGKIVKAPKVKK